MAISNSITPKGKTYIATEAGETLAMAQALGKVQLPNGTFAQVKRAFVNAATNATTELIPADAENAFRIIALFMLGGATAPTVTLKSDTTAISSVLANAANGGAVLPPNLYGWFQTLDVNKALNVTVSSSSDVGIVVNFIEIPADCLDLL